LDPGAPECWRGVYGDTLAGRGGVSVIGEEPLENCS